MIFKYVDSVFIIHSREHQLGFRIPEKSCQRTESKKNTNTHKHTAKKLVGEVVDFALYLNSCSGAFNKLELLYFERTAY